MTSLYKGEHPVTDIYTRPGGVQVGMANLQEMVWRWNADRDWKELGKYSPGSVLGKYVREYTVWRSIFAENPAVGSSTIDRAEPFSGSANQQAAQALAKSLQKSEFTPTNGMILKWTHNGKYNHAAIWADGSWYTTAQGNNGYGMKAVMKHHELKAHLRGRKNEITNLGLADTFIDINY